MLLSEYLLKYNYTQEDFSRKIGVAQQSVSKWLLGTRPTPKVSCRIVEFTKGKISFTDLGWHATDSERLKKIFLRRKREREYANKRRKNASSQRKA